MQDSTSRRSAFYQQFTQVRPFPAYLLMLTFIFSALLIFDFWAGTGKIIWLFGILIIIAWMPLIISTMSTIYQKNRTLAFLYLLVVAQIAHTIEHLAQMVELHILGFHASNANGIIGFLNIEWVHLVWNSLILVAAFMLLFAYRRNIWLWTLFIFAIYHEAEHVYIVSIYVQTGRAGNPGLLAKGGIIGGGLPITRPDLHAIYAVFEMALLLIIYYGEQRNFRQAQAAKPALATG